ncbi:sulfatase, partial [Saccharophagus degradans]|nr:sulfatase [Saccharophagus degradans]
MWSFKNITSVSLLVLVFGLQSCQSQDQKEKKPNIIFFFTDDQSYDTQKDFGNSKVKTPNLD